MISLHIVASYKELHVKRLQAELGLASKTGRGVPQVSPCIQTNHFGQQWYVRKANTVGSLFSGRRWPKTLEVYVGELT